MLPLGTLDSNTRSRDPTGFTKAGLLSEPCQKVTNVGRPLSSDGSISQAEIVRNILHLLQPVKIVQIDKELELGSSLSIDLFSVGLGDGF